MTASTAPTPPIPEGLDLHDFSFVPIYRVQLFRSAFHARASAEEWRAGVTLWLKSWDQVPCGSLPDDDFQLCSLAELGRDQRTWKKIKAMALWNWYLCDDGRLYHDVVAEGVLLARGYRGGKPSAPKPRKVIAHEGNILPFPKKESP